MHTGRDNLVALADSVPLRKTWGEAIPPPPCHLFHGDPAATLALMGVPSWLVVLLMNLMAGNTAVIPGVI